MAGVCHTGQSMGFQHSAVEAAVRNVVRSLVVFAMPYNAECWPMRKNNTDALEGFIYRCLRRVTRLERGSPGPLEDHPSRAEVVGVAASPHAEQRVGESGFAGWDNERRSTASTNDYSTQ